MLKILIKSIIIYLFFTTLVFSEIIKNIDISGNKRISKETILVLVVFKGEDYDNDKLNDSLKLYKRTSSRYKDKF